MMALTVEQRRPVAAHDRQEEQLVTMSYRCRTCGETHEGPPFSWGFGAPAGWPVTADPASGCRGELSDEQAILECEGETDYFMRGNIWLPVTDGDEDFSFTVWVSLSEASFQRSCDVWDDPARADEPPYFGWLSSDVPGYPTTISLKTHVHTQPVGVRPHIELEPTDHPLAVEQREGITVARVIEIAEAMEAHMASGEDG
jgi:hypothetical protein